MKILSLIVLFSTTVYCQEDPQYVLFYDDNGAYFEYYGDRYYLSEKATGCFESAESTKMTAGENFLIIQIYDEMENSRGVIIFDFYQKLVDISKVQEVRKDYYEFEECCVWVMEYDEKLIFLDISDLDSVDYDCYYDSQTDAAEYWVPRYYIFDPLTKEVEIIKFGKSIDEFVLTILLPGNK